ncbi:hypothetical protein LJC47_00005, partial [Desulfosarcina sp. OttesenSCG-928-B08]|nr:hypothetical protein [Desulfosarcina sp. OttesenSCG-928-B08]
MPVFDTNEYPFTDLRPLLSHSHITLQSPDIPDADSVAAAFALYLFFTANHKPTEWFYAGKTAIDTPCLLEMVDVFDLPIRHIPSPAPCPGLLIRVGGCTDGMHPVAAEEEALFACHASAANLPAASDIRPYLTACSTLVYQLLKNASFPVSRTLGTALRFGLYAASNSFTEIRFPLDKDMRDEVACDPVLFKRLANSNLRPRDLEIAAKALNTLDFSSENNCVISNVLPCDAEILRFITDLALHVQGVSIALAFYETAQGIRFSLRSALRDVHAGKLARRFTEKGRGSSGGTSEKAGGMMHRPPHTEDPSFPSTGMELVAMFQCYIDEYRNTCDIIDCIQMDTPSQTFVKSPLLPETFYAYQKLPVPHAFVICSHIFPR